MPHHVLVQRLRVGDQHAQARALPAPGAAEALPGRRHGARVAVEHDHVEAADVHAQLQRRGGDDSVDRSEEHTSELQSLMRISYAVFCLKKTKVITISNTQEHKYNVNHISR